MEVPYHSFLSGTDTFVVEYEFQEDDGPIRQSHYRTVGFSSRVTPGLLLGTGSKFNLK